MESNIKGNKFVQYSCVMYIYGVYCTILLKLSSILYSDPISIKDYLWSERSVVFLKAHLDGAWLVE
jgi:hypothetical protein